MISSIRAQAPPPQQHRFRRAAEEVVGAAFGIGFGLGSTVTNACAGGAEGLVHGSGIQSHKGLATQAAFAANLAVAGAVTGGPWGAVTNLVSGEAVYHFESSQVKQNVAKAADAWTDKVAAHVPGSGVLHRVASAAVGEVVGAAAGALGGALSAYHVGHESGKALVDRLSGQK
ncbi:MAG: hypothetical protein ACYCW6_23540 [Candidatus Xenobia bacterium]